MKNLKIKSIAAILSVLICAVPISAEESHPTLTEQKVAAVLVDKATGETIDIDVTPVAKGMRSGIEASDSYEVRVALPRDGIQPRGSDTSTDQDGYYSVTGSLTITYDRALDSHNNYSYKLTKVNGSWKITDDGVKLSNRDVSWQCSSFSPRVVQEGHKSPTSNTYSYNTGFTKYIGEYDMNAWVGATSLVDISKGARNWELQVTVNKVYNSTRSVAR